MNGEKRTYLRWQMKENKGARLLASAMMRAAAEQEATLSEFKAACELALAAYEDATDPSGVSTRVILGNAEAALDRLQIESA